MYLYIKYIGVICSLYYVVSTSFSVVSTSCCVVFTSCCVSCIAFEAYCYFGGRNLFPAQRPTSAAAPLPSDLLCLLHNLRCYKPYFAVNTNTSIVYKLVTFQYPTTVMLFLPVTNTGIRCIFVRVPPVAHVAV